jgi:hypothetical protein
VRNQNLGYLPTQANSLADLDIVFSSDRLIGYSFISAEVLMPTISEVISKGKIKETNVTGGV